MLILACNFHVHVTTRHEYINNLVGVVHSAICVPAINFLCVSEYKKTSIWIRESGELGHFIPNQVLSQLLTTKITMKINMKTNVEISMKTHMKITLKIDGHFAVNDH